METIYNAMTKIKKPTEGKAGFVWPKAGETRKTANGVKKKKCGKCGRWLGLEKFPRDKHRLDGLYGYCRECESKRQKKKNEKLKKVKK